MNDSEQSVYRKYENLGYDVIQYGIPDLILLKNGKIEFVEVKTDSGYGLNKNQIRTINLLKKHGIEARVETVKYRSRINKRSLYHFPLGPINYHKAPCFPPWLFEQT